MSRLRSLLQQGLAEPEFCVDLVYKIRKNVGKAEVSDQFKKLSCDINALALMSMRCDSLHAW